MDIYGKDKVSFATKIACSYQVGIILFMLDFILGKIRNISAKFSLFTFLKKEKTVVSKNNTQINIYNTFPSVVIQKYDPSAIEKIKGENLKKISVGIHKIPKENRVSLKPYKSYKAIQALHYVTEKDLSEWFIELLVKSADSRYTNKVKVRYQEILSVLDPDDAKLLKFIFFNKYVVNIKAKDLMDIVDQVNEQSIKKIPENSNIRISVPGIPFLEIRNKSAKNSAGWNTIHKIFTNIEILPINKNVEEVESQLEHLASLNLIEIKSNFWFLPVTLYSHLENNEYILNLNKQVGEQRSIEKIKGRIDLTTFGKDFLSIVLKNQSNLNKNKHASD